MAEERDFLNLKLMTDDKVEDSTTTTSVYMRGSGMQWPFTNKISAFMPVSTADAFDATHKSFNGLLQSKNFSVERQGGSHYAPVQHVDAHWTHCAPETVTAYTNNHPFLKSRGATSRQIFNPTTRQQPLGGTPVTTQLSYVPMAATVEQSNVSKPIGPSTQLTIFYGGSVKVFDDISPETARNIMYLAGKGSAVSPKMTTPSTQVQVCNSRAPGGDGGHGNQSHATLPCSGLPSPISVTSHANPQSGSGSSATDESRIVRPIASLTDPSRQPELPKAAFPFGCIPTAMLPAAAVPQARKASLARFLSKRRERTTSTMPYNLNVKSPDCSPSPGSNSISLFGNTVLSSIPASKEPTWCLGLSNNDSSFENVQMKQ